MSFARVAECRAPQPDLGRLGDAQKPRNAPISGDTTASSSVDGFLGTHLVGTQGTGENLKNFSALPESCGRFSASGNMGVPQFLPQFP